jgi:hypothetical protein
MKAETQNRIQAFLEEFVTQLTTVPYSLEELEQAYPFHSLFFREEALKAFKQQRRIVTRMGQTLYPTLAEMIALDRYSNVHRDFRIEGILDAAKVETIEGIVDELRRGLRRPSHEEEMEAIIKAKSRARQDVVTVADLYIGDYQPGPFFTEIKSPLPNLDICAESKKAMLIFIALELDKGHEPQAFLSLTYNPFITRERYRHWPTFRIMDFQRQVLIGPEFWDALGGEGTYRELMQIVEKVKQETSWS